MQEYLEAGGVLAGLRAGSKKQLLALLAAAAARHMHQPEAAVLSAITEREKLGSTGVGKGIALPHAKLPGLDRVRGLFARLAAPVEFDAIDGEPVDLVFLLLAPAEEATGHLKALAFISRALRDPAVTARLRGADSEDAILAILAKDADRSAA